MPHNRAASGCRTVVTHGYAAPMTRVSVSLDDQTAEAVREVAGGDGKVSGWVAGVVRDRLLADACAAAGAFDAADDDPQWETARLQGNA